MNYKDAYQLYDEKGYFIQSYTKLCNARKHLKKIGLGRIWKIRYWENGTIKYMTLYSN